MTQKPFWVWQVLIATLIFVQSAFAEEISVQFDAAEEILVIHGLSPSEQSELLAKPDFLRLQIAGQSSARSMLMKLAGAEDAVHVHPRFSLRHGKQYVLAISLPDREGFETKLLVADDIRKPPRLVKFEPSHAVIPANILRLYLMFSEPIARGQAGKFVTLHHSDGTIVQSPFLNLSTELWDQSQKRLTLLFDPGRMKEGVGPNVSAGPPLEPGESYRLVVSGDLESAAGEPVGQDVAVSLRIGHAKNDPINPQEWEIQMPKAGSKEPVSIAFDRIIDTAAARRMLKLVGPDGYRVPGGIHTDGGGWSIFPPAIWKAGLYTLEIDPELEDVSGNNLRTAFDGGEGAIGKVTEPIFMNVPID
ncbi:MAG: Ig-like domain-containing protein [Pseudomonadota bacterium]